MLCDFVNIGYHVVRLKCKWKQIIECRVCKCGLVSYLGQRLPKNTLNGIRNFTDVVYSSDGDNSDKIWYVPIMLV